MGKTVFFSTHILADVAEICTRIGIIEAGRLIAAGPIGGLSQDLVSQRRICIKILGNGDRAAMLLDAHPGVRGIQSADPGTGDQPGLLKFWFQGEDLALSKLLAVLINGGVDVIQFSEENEDLEDVFLRITQGLVT
jgi:ABC-2 type transport system ATP-binding protein